MARHGARLHDQFMLPAALWADLQEVCADLAEAGLPFERGWLREIFEWRFPVLGTLELGGGEARIRQALEPWPLMAETSDGGATSRMVDNSTDRLEVSISDAGRLAERRVLVDGIELRFTEIGNVLAAGIRYKAAGGWPALHPHVPIQSPIRIEVVDARDRIVASARYHYWNPDGPRYEGPPKSVEEAAERQLARWRREPSRIGRHVVPRAPSYTEESAVTLDLRRQPNAE